MTNDQIRLETALFSLEHAARSAVGGAVGALVIVAMVARTVGLPIALTWGLFAIGMLAWRSVALRRRAAHLRGLADVAGAVRALRGSTLALAVVLAVLPLSVMAAATMEMRMLLTVIMCCWGAAAMGSLGATPGLYAAYLGIIMLGIFGGWLQVQTAFLWETGLCLVLMWVVLLTFARSFASRVHEGIAIRAENAELVAQLSLANQAKTRFIMTASHDLRQPLHAISLLGRALRGTTEPSHLDRGLKELDAAIQGLNHLFFAILDLSRLETGTVRPEMSQEPLHELVARLDRDYRALCMEQGRRWECEVEAVVAVTDAVLLERLLRNLLDNALKHAGSGGIRLCCSPTPEGGARFVVADTGRGIPAAEQQRVFEEFYRLADAGQTMGGLGLGLSIVKRLAGLLGGTIAIRHTDAERETGTTIELVLAPAVALAPARGLGAVSDDSEHADVRGLTVAVLDDEASVRSATGRLLEQWGCEVLLYGSIGEALARMDDASRPIDVALVDYRLGNGRTGLEAASDFRSRQPAMGIVFVTGETSSGVRARILEAGYPLLDKPVKPDELRTTLSLFKTVAME